MIAMLSGEVSKTKIRVINSYIWGAFFTILGGLSLYITSFPELRKIAFLSIFPFAIAIISFAYGERLRRKFKRGAIPVQSLKPSKPNVISGYFLAVANVLVFVVVAVYFGTLWGVLASPFLAFSVVYFVAAERLRRELKKRVIRANPEMGRFKMVRSGEPRRQHA